MSVSVHLSRRTWAGLILAAPLIALLVLNLVTGFGLRDAKALGRYFAHRRTAVESVWRGAGSEGEFADYVVLGDNSVLALREGGLCALEGGALRSLGTSQGLLRLFQAGESGRIWAAGTYHRLLASDAVSGLCYILSVTGAVREVRDAQDRLFVGFEGNDLGSGTVKIFRRKAEGIFQPEGIEIPVGMDRWSGFDLSSDGLRILANLADGKGVGVWSTADGRLLASWPAERMARILCFLDDGRVLFDHGPALQGMEAAYANPRNRLLMAWIDASAKPAVIAENCATVLSSTRWPDRRRMAFSDTEGLVRVVDLVPEPRLAATFAPKGRGIPWRLRPGSKGVWVLLKGEEVRLERFGLD